MEDLVNSIGEVGLLQPIVMTPDNTIISGHRRFKAIQSLGWTEVECEIKDISQDEIDVHIVLYNQSRVKVATEMLREIKVLYQNLWTGRGNNYGESGGYDNKRSWHFQKKLGKLRKKIGIPEGVVFHTLRNTFATRMENLGIPRNHISQLMGHEDSNMALTVYSGGLAIERLVESINKLTYEEVDPFIKETLKN